jgi:hypothetical protein
MIEMQGVEKIKVLMRFEREVTFTVIWIYEPIIRLLMLTKITVKKTDLVEIIFHIHSEISYPHVL